jgi:hypothetical protein
MSLHSPAGVDNHCRARGPCYRNKGGGVERGSNRTPQLLGNPLSAPKQARRQSGEAHTRQHARAKAARQKAAPTKKARGDGGASEGRSHTRTVAAHPPMSPRLDTHGTTAGPPTPRHSPGAAHQVPAKEAIESSTRRGRGDGGHTSVSQVWIAEGRSHDSA